MLPLTTRRTIFERLRTHAAWVLVAALAMTAVLAIPFLTMGSDETASQEPGGVVFEARDRLEERFIPRVLPVPMIVEAAEGSITDKPTLAALLAPTSVPRCCRPSTLTPDTTSSAC